MANTSRDGCIGFFSTTKNLTVHSEQKKASASALAFWRQMVF